MSEHAAPTALHERIATLDAIRGVALLGIFIMNMPYFSASFFSGSDGVEAWPQWWNRAAEIARDVLFSGKFNSMFSMLFAVGFTIQLERLAERQPEHATLIYARRIFWLFVFGVAHACVLWTGDILHMYALFGFALLGLRKLPDRALIALIALCMLYPAIAGGIRMATFEPRDLDHLQTIDQQWLVFDNAIYGHGTFTQAVRHNTRTMRFLYGNSPSRWELSAGYVQILTTMTLGLLLGRRRFFQNSSAHLPLVRRLQWWALAIGLASGAVFAIWEVVAENPMRPSVWRIASGLAYVICRLSIMTFYVALVIRGMHNERWRRLLYPVTLAGRMPLTNYLLQSLIGTFIFYHWGLGFWNKAGPALDIALAVGIFLGIQVPLSSLWLRRFPLGPMEYLWRVLTYGRAAVRHTNNTAGEVPAA